MGLKERIDSHFGAVDDFVLSSWSDPVLGSLRAREDAERLPVILTRYAGTLLFGAGRRHEVLLAAVVSVSDSSDWADGGGLEELQDRLIRELNQVPDCYPELLPAQAEYQFQLGRLATRPTSRSGRSRPTSNTYIALLIRCLSA